MIIFYRTFTKLLNQNILSILIAILSGIIINLLTNQSIVAYYIAPISYLVVAIILLVLLINLNEVFKKRFKTKKADNPSESNDLIWEKAITHKVWYKYVYYSVLLGVFISTGYSTYSVYDKTVRLKIDETSKDQKMNELIISISDSIFSLNRSLRRTEEIFIKNDSLYKLNQIKLPSNLEKKLRVK